MGLQPCARTTGRPAQGCDYCNKLFSQLPPHLFLNWGIQLSKLPPHLFLNWGILLSKLPPHLFLNWGILLNKLPPRLFLNWGILLSKLPPHLFLNWGILLRKLPPHLFLNWGILLSKLPPHLFLNWGILLSKPPPHLFLRWGIVILLNKLPHLFLLCRILFTLLRSLSYMRLDVLHGVQDTGHLRLSLQQTTFKLLHLVLRCRDNRKCYSNSTQLTGFLSDIQNFSHIDGKAKWLPFCKHFQFKLIFLNEKVVFLFKFHWYLNNITQILWLLRPDVWQTLINKISYTKTKQEFCHYSHIFLSSALSRSLSRSRCLELLLRYSLDSNSSASTPLTNFFCSGSKRMSAKGLCLLR